MLPRRNCILAIEMPSLPLSLPFFLFVSLSLSCTRLRLLLLPQLLLLLSHCLFRLLSPAAFVFSYLPVLLLFMPQLSALANGCNLATECVIRLMAAQKAQPNWGWHLNGLCPPACGIEKRSLNCLVGSFRVGKNSGENDIYILYCCLYICYIYPNNWHMHWTNMCRRKRNWNNGRGNFITESKHWTLSKICYE